MINARSRIFLVAFDQKFFVKIFLLDVGVENERIFLTQMSCVANVVILTLKIIILCLPVKKA
jgi:hypothetical protein